MNEEQKKNGADPKENTLDIFVSPKRRSAAPQEEPVAKKKPEGRKIPTAKRAPSAPSVSPEKKETEAPKREDPICEERTRAIRTPNGIASQSAAEKAEETRVSGPVPIPPKKSKDPTPASPKKEEKEEGKKKNGKQISPWKDSFRTTIVRTMIYMVVVVGISVLLAYLGISWGNDVFALVKEEVTATVTIPENATISEVADILAEKGIIEYPSIFRLYIGFKNDDGLVFKPGEHEVKSTLNYDQLVSLMKDRKTRSIIRLTIPEGYTVDEIIDLFLSKGMGTREGFVDAINNFPYDYSFMEKLNEIELSPNRRYRLEGYLFPDTYEFYTDSKEVAIIDKMLAAFQYRFDEDYYARLEELNMNLDQIITLASIVQMEGKYNVEFYPISGVFHNRLRSRTLKKLESDATVQYCLKERKEDLTYEDLAIDDPYNSYLYEGLPPSAIANPGWEAIQAAMYPESHGYYYFVADTDGSTIFAESHAEHLKNVADVAKAKENGTSVD